MTRPVTSSKVLLVADRREEPAGAHDAPVRRFRLARLRIDGRPSAPQSRYEQIKRA